MQLHATERTVTLSVCVCVCVSVCGVYVAYCTMLAYKHPYSMYLSVRSIFRDLIR
jgi:hypothetical protein